jgi:H-NS histone family
MGPVAPKYRNPENPSEAWAGRGLKPRWLTAVSVSCKLNSEITGWLDMRSATVTRLELISPARSASP